MERRRTWQEIQLDHTLTGHWVALDECTCDPESGRPVAGVVVDADENLVALCRRLQESPGMKCAIHYCDEAESVPPSSRRRYASPVLASGRRMIGSA